MSKKNSTFAPLFRKGMSRAPENFNFLEERRRPRETYPYDEVVQQSEGAEREGY